jgi:hypothetical protein
MNLYFLSLLEKEKRKRTRWLITKDRDISTRRLNFVIPQHYPGTGYEAGKYMVSIAHVTKPGREPICVFMETRKPEQLTQVRSMVHIQSLLSNETFKKKNFMLRFNFNVAVNIKDLSKI